jgi:tetratricopeptide (TPR) repeat protein
MSPMRFPFLACVLAVAGIPFLAAASEPARCKLVRVAEWPLRIENGRPIVEGAVNGKPVKVLVHTAAYISLVTKAAAQRLDLAVTSTAERLSDGSVVQVSRIDELRIGTETAKALRLRVALDGPVPGVDVILGKDFLSRYDIELDLPGRAIRAFRPDRCVGESLAYWDRSTPKVGLERGDDVDFPVRINGKAAIARLDTSALESEVERSFAEKLGLKEGQRSVWTAGCTGRGTGHMAVFDSFEIAHQETKPARIYIGTRHRHADPGPDVIIGNDFLRRHRVLIARSQANLYFSYKGGQIFSALPSLPCDQRIAGKKAGEARAILDAAIAANPKDTNAILRRASLRGSEELSAAIADTDAVLANDNGNVLALQVRYGLRKEAGDFRGALADVDAMMVAGFVVGGSYLERARLLAAMGDHAAALESADLSFQLQPESVASFSTRGRLYYHANRLEEAERDLAKVVAMRGNGIDHVWLALVRMRRGADPAAVLQEGLAKGKEGEWPAPVMRHLAGQLDREALLAAAASGEEGARKGRECEAVYYAAARLLIEGKRVDARPLLERAAKACPHTYREFDAAVTDLKSLG